MIVLDAQKDNTLVAQAQLHVYEFQNVLFAAVDGFC